MALTRTPRYVSLWGRLVTGGRPPDAASLGDFIEGYLNGSLAREHISVTQTNLENRRPLPSRLSTNAEVIVHLADLWYASTWDERIVSDPRGYAESSRQWLEACKNQVAPAAGDASVTALPPMHGLGMVEAFLRDDLGGGNIINGFRRARAMATDGMLGGIHALRHKFLTKQILSRLKEVHRDLYSMLLALDVPAREAVAARAAKTIGSLHPHFGITTPTDVLALWKGTVEEFVMITAESAIPAELA